MDTRYTAKVTGNSEMDTKDTAMVTLHSAKDTDDTAMVTPHSEMDTEDTAMVTILSEENATCGYSLATANGSSLATSDRRVSGGNSRFRKRH